MKNLQYCYWCGKTATSREHVPPKCLFPEKKDSENIFEQNFRKDLITVPACDEHNLEKSDNDEYLMTVLSGRFGNNGVAYVHNATKVSRARKRNKHLINIKESGIVDTGEMKYPVNIITLDNPRLYYSFEAIGRALFFHEFSRSFNGECRCMSNIFVDFDKQSDESFMTKAISMLKNDQRHWNTEIQGANPQIFQYQFSPRDDFGTSTVYLQFYEKTEIFVIMREYIEQEMGEGEKKKFDNAVKTAKKLAEAIFKDLE